jgi:hypothetical protein
MVTLIWGEGRQEAHCGGCSTAVGGRPEGMAGGARGGADVAGRGPVRAGVAEALDGSGTAPVALFGVSARRQGGWLRTGKWRRRPWHSCSGAQGAAVRPGRRWLSSRARRAEERGGTNRMEREGETLGVELTADKGGRGRSAAHVEVVLHGRCVGVGGRWRGGVAARGERGDEATRVLG